MKLNIIFLFFLQIGYSQVEVIEETFTYCSNLQTLNANLVIVSNNELNDILIDVIKPEQNCYNNHWVINLSFQNEREYNINGTVIKKGETKYGLIGIKADSFDSLKLKIK